MNPRFSITIEPSRDIVTIFLNGLLMPTDVAALFEARRAVHLQLRCPPGRHVTLTDMRAMSIQPRETVAAFATLLSDPQSRARRLAFVVVPTLLRSQLVRALAGRDSRFFADPDEARAWLLDDEESARRPFARKKVPFLRAVG